MCSVKPSLRTETLKYDKVLTMQIAREKPLWAEGMKCIEAVEGREPAVLWDREGKRCD